MKKSFPVIVSVLCAVASVSMAQKPVPYTETFENYAPGSNMVGSVWQGDANTAIAVVSNFTYTPPSKGYAVQSAEHTKVMAFSEGTITNEFNGTSITVAAIDTMIKPSFCEERPTADQMGAVTNSQVSVYIDTNGYLNIYHGVMDAPFPGPPVLTQWTILTNAVPLTTGSWCRLTVVMNYDIANSMSMFKIGVNGSYINSPEGYVSPDVGTDKDGQWFVSPKWYDGDLQLHRIILSGSGMLDDMVVGTNEVTFPEGPLYATNGVPVSWMETSGLSTNSTNTTWDAVALADDDSDGVTNWQEWVTGTSPTNWSSKLIIVSSTYSNGFPILKWIGSASAQNNYTIQWSSNLLSVLAWTNAIENWPKADGTNEVTLQAPAVSPAFLRVTVPVP